VSDTKPIDERSRLDETALEAWLQANVANFAGPLQLAQFKGGQSNPTYRIDTAQRAYVLRRKPFGPLLPSAHAVDREFRVISALHAQGFPVAEPFALCTDAAIIGADFYVMQCVEGRIFWNGALPDCAPTERTAIYNALTETLARLHAFDPAAIGLGNYGKPGNYFARQIERWTKQYRASETERIEEMENLIAFLPQALPEQSRTSIVHGDYRIDNCMLHAREPSVVAVLDWELSTLGDPLADFSYFLMSWVMPADGGSSLGGLDLPALEIPITEQIASHYCELTGRDTLPPLDWLFAYNLFRLSAICQGIAGRVRDGTAASAEAARKAALARPLAEAAWNFAQKAGA
jgi:aminoglycoside phosphotransferase (APT) family kinase protein